jgi:secreted trypsin-like serine protease
MIPGDAIMNLKSQEFLSCHRLRVLRPQGLALSSCVALSRHWILTAGHCVEGEIKNIELINASGPQLTYQASEFYIHPGYNSSKSKYINDIALIKINSSLPEMNIHLWDKSFTDPRAAYFRLGFGQNSNQMIKTYVHPKFKKLNHVEKTIELFDSQSYAGDSGGPIYICEKNKFYLMAIHSTFSWGPEGYFSYNPLLGPELDWINSIIRTHTYKQNQFESPAQGIQVF